MAQRGSKKDLSQHHEQFVAEQYEGKRSSSSGAADHDQGDVRVVDDATLFECKGKFGERTGQKPVRSTLVTQMEKVADEAWSEGRDPAIALRFYKPDSILADSDGFIDLTVRLLRDDSTLMDERRGNYDLYLDERERHCDKGRTR